MYIHRVLQLNYYYWYTADSIINGYGMRNMFNKKIDICYYVIKKSLFRALRLRLKP